MQIPASLINLEHKTNYKSKVLTSVIVQFLISRPDRSFSLLRSIFKYPYSVRMKKKTLSKLARLFAKVNLAIFGFSQRTV